MDISGLGYFLYALQYILPTKKNRTIKQHLRLLKKEQDWLRLKDKFLVLSMMTTTDVRDFLYEQPVEEMLNDEQQRGIFFTQLEKICEDSGL